jgi:hypothetical protein
MYLCSPQLVFEIITKIFCGVSPEVSGVARRLKPDKGIKIKQYKDIAGLVPNFREYLVG